MLGLAKFALFAAAMDGIHDGLMWAVPRAPWATIGGLFVALICVSLVLDPRSRRRSEMVYSLKCGMAFVLIVLLAMLHDVMNGYPLP